MFGQQAAAFAQQYAVAGGDPRRQAQAIQDFIGECMAHLVHRGPIEFLGPVRFGSNVPPAFSTVPQFPGAKEPGHVLSVTLDAELSGDFPDQPVLASVINWSPHGIRPTGEKLRVYPGLVLTAGETIPADTPLYVTAVNDRLVPLSSLSGLGGAGSGGGFLTGNLRLGKLAGVLIPGGSATVTTWMFDGDEFSASGQELTAYDWLLRSGGPGIPSGTKVVIARIGGYWFVIQAGC